MERLETEQTEQVQHDHNGLAKKARHVCSHCHSKRDVSQMRKGHGVTRFGKQIWYCLSCPDQQGGYRSPMKHGGVRRPLIKKTCSQCGKYMLPLSAEAICFDCEWENK